MLKDYFVPEYTPDFDWMSASIVDTGEMVYWAGREGDFESHLRVLETTFSGLPFLCFYHSGVIVQLRRKIDEQRNAELFFRMWREKGEVLLKNLSSRWLVSACDTILDISDDPLERAIALNGTLLVNVVKLYETERYVTGAKGRHLPGRAGTINLFDGVMKFNIGNGDMISNMVRRAGELSLNSSIAGPILMELFNRVQSHNTVFQRLERERKRIVRRRRLKAKLKQGHSN